MHTLNVALPRPLKVIVEYMLNKKMQDEVNADEPNLEEMKQLNQQAKRMQLTFDREQLTFAISQRMERFMRQLEKDPDNLQLMAQLNELLPALHATTLQPDLWQAQNIAFRIKQQYYAQHPTDSEWSALFTKLFDNLNLKV
jgi:hypothetical protein